MLPVLYQTNYLPLSLYGATSFLIVLSRIVYVIVALMLFYNKQLGNPVYLGGIAV